MDLEPLSELIPDQQSKPKEALKKEEPVRECSIPGAKDHLEVYRLLLEKCYRMNLIDSLVDPLVLVDHSITELKELTEHLDNTIVNALMPGINRILNRGLFDMYQVLYTIDVDEEMIKAKIMDLENTTMIPSIIAFAIIDRLKRRYKSYPLLANKTT